MTPNDTPSPSVLRWRGYGVRTCARRTTAIPRTPRDHPGPPSGRGKPGRAAEREGFEPSAPGLPAQLLSRQPCSATPAPLLRLKSPAARPGRHVTRRRFPAPGGGGRCRRRPDRPGAKWPSDRPRSRRGRTSPRRRPPPPGGLVSARPARRSADGPPAAEPTAPAVGSAAPCVVRIALSSVTSSPAEPHGPRIESHGGTTPGPGPLRLCGPRPEAAAAPEDGAPARSAPSVAPLTSGGPAS